jgi:hypothetical protein
MNYQPGTRVMHAAEVIYRAHDYYLSQGREPMRSGARRAWEKIRAARGTIIEPDPLYCSADKYAVSVKWDDGTTSHCLRYRIQRAPEPPPDPMPHPECCGEPMDCDGRLVLCFTCGYRREV